LAWDAHLFTHALILANAPQPIRSRQFTDLLLGAVKVLDTCSATSGKSIANTASRINALADVTAHDGVHFTPEGCFNLARSLGADMDALAAPKLPKSRQKQDFKRGFCSTVGADTQASGQDEPSTGSVDGTVAAWDHTRASTHSIHTEDNLK
jgi:hypothetical protein